MDATRYLVMSARDPMQTAPVEVAPAPVSPNQQRRGGAAESTPALAAGGTAAGRQRQFSGKNRTTQISGRCSSRYVTALIIE
jgi:hypothetical protein